MAESPRPTREQVDEVLSHSSTTYAETVLAAEVRALRADLDTAQEAHAADTDELERLRTPQPAEDLTEVLLAEVALAAGYKGQPSRGLVEHVAALHSAALAPQPAVPDGEDPPRQIVVAPDTSMTVRAALTLAASQEEEAWSLGKRLVHRHRLVMEALERDAGGQVGGEDVPAQLDAAADALEARGKGLGSWFRQAANDMRRLRPDDRAAVAAALARPTGHQQ